jgi:hypothetical protein
VSDGCAAPVAFADLVAYWAGDVDAAAGEQLEEHLMGCAACTRASARVAALSERLRALVPPLLSRAKLQQLQRKGLRIVENPMRPGERREVLFPRGVDILLHRLGGLDLAQATQVRFVLRAEGSEQTLLTVEEAPFDRDAGELLLACSLHYAAMPPDTVAEVRATDVHGDETLTAYTILHRFA